MSHYGTKGTPARVSGPQTDQRRGQLILANADLVSQWLRHSNRTPANASPVSRLESGRPRFMILFQTSQSPMAVPAVRATAIVSQ